MGFNFNRKYTRVTKTRPELSSGRRFRLVFEGVRRAKCASCRCRGSPDRVVSFIRADPVAATSDKCIRYSAVKG